MPGMYGEWIMTAGFCSRCGWKNLKLWWFKGGRRCSSRACFKWIHSNGYSSCVASLLRLCRWSCQVEGRDLRSPSWGKCIYVKERLSCPSHQRLVNSVPTSGVVVLSKMSHVCLQMTWLQNWGKQGSKWLPIFKALEKYQAWRNVWNLCMGVGLMLAVSLM